MTTGERIKQARLQKGITQEELGRLIGVQRAAINKYESGAVSNLKRTTIAKLAKALNVKPTWLMCMDDDEDTSTSDDELTEILEACRERSDLRMLFKLSAGATAEDVRQAIKIIEALRNND